MRRVAMAIALPCLIRRRKQNKKKRDHRKHKKKGRSHGLKWEGDAYGQTHLF